MFKFFSIISLVIVFVGCATSMKDGTSAKLRPDLTDDDTEIWEINSEGNSYTSSERVRQNAMQRAAFTSKAEGRDCFFVSNSISDVKTYVYTTYKKDTINTTSSGYMESSKGDTVYNVRNTQQEVYVPENHSYSKAYTNLYVRFMKTEECQQLGKTKWRQNIHYNKDFITDQ
ncbi:MAG: hypothetical protein LBC87_05035 [Fibromonadaceae bacterium]|jgi:hypothetical protein|nr:hypothetical protein [Fibromonadaceae bacterium]